MNWAAIVANVAEQPYPSQIQQYKEWRRAGSKREDYCCICLLTPPASPQPAPAQIHHPPGHATSGTNSNAASIPHLLCPAPSLEPQREGLETQSAPEESEPSAIDKNTGHEVTDLGPAVQTATEGSQPTRRQRKSRYSTLPSNVDASLAVLYQELESVAMLRAEIEKLRTQNTQYAQTIKIQEQNQIALRRDLGALRENVTNSESTTKEIRELRERNAALEAELLVSKEQTAAAKELKERLAQLLNT
ncbi:hypothetical protein LT330_003337 [Penicillium expansum]|nr:hypothetical protein LT330_003337 [Penicillium expansum]